MSFFNEFQRYSWDGIREEIYSRTDDDVTQALLARNHGLEELVSLLSPAADSELEELARQAQQVTEQRFGRIVGLYAPLYLSSSCTNSCLYCSFNTNNPIRRLTLTPDQAEAEGAYLREMGFRHVLLVSGEDRSTVDKGYFLDVIERLRSRFDSISVEIYPMESEEYGELARCGVDGLIVYQETYNKGRYSEVHKGGRKRDYRWRLETPERGGQAGFRRLGIGALLGLSDWRVEAVCLALHARYLMKHYWRSQITISFPRLRPAVGGYVPPNPVSDRDMVHMLTALRLVLPDAGLLLSTRESSQLRDNMVPLGVTSMSAGSRTEPGGYTMPSDSEGQFEISDHRSPDEVAGVLRGMGYEPVWKDWDAAFILAEDSGSAARSEEKLA
jgi:2-iminoacetate synthase